eukprot:COSAG02_NODE_7794_length_2843_cov_1.120262_1_plen_138_part_00
MEDLAFIQSLVASHSEPRDDDDDDDEQSGNSGGSSSRYTRAPARTLPQRHALGLRCAGGSDASSRCAALPFLSLLLFPPAVLQLPCPDPLAAPLPGLAAIAATRKRTAAAKRRRRRRSWLEGTTAMCGRWRTAWRRW